MKDMINPDHYKQGSVECYEAIYSALGKEGFIAYCKGNIIKYNWRLGKKDDPVQESNKAMWYQQKIVDVLTEDTSC